MNEEKEQEVVEQEVKQIKLSFVLARYLWPVYADAFSNARDDFANKILKRMKK